MDAYLTRLGQLSINCDFGENKDKEIKSQIIQGCSSSRLRRRALREDHTLEQLLKLAQSMKLSDKQACEIEHSDNPESANAVHAFKKKYRSNKKKTYHKSEPKENAKNNMKELWR